MRITKRQTRAILKSIEHRLKHITFDANLHDLFNADIPTAINCSRERRLLHEARAIIEAEMGINDPIEVQHNAKHGDYIVARGKETFYDEDNVMWVFDTIEEATQWCITNLGTYPILPDVAEEAKISKRKKQDDGVVQLDLGL